MAYANFSQNNTKTQIKFFSGSQADLTKYIKGTTEAIEGAFYLTTDTQKLYVGRKDQNDGKVYAVQVSRGVTFVSSSSQLPSVTANDIEEGELYYITSSNILAALKHVPADNTVTPAISDHYEWVQINPPTGINTVSTSAVNESGTNNVILSTLISTAAGSKTGKTKFIAGNNITLTGGDTTLGESPNTFAAGTVTINATDTTYSIGTDATPNNKTEGIIELRTNGNTSDTHNTQVSIKGYSSTDTNGDDGTNLQVSSDDQGNVIIR